MKTVEIHLDGKDFVVGRLDAQKSTFISFTIFTPLLLSLEAAAKSAGQDMASLMTMLSGLEESKFNKIVQELFPLIKIREKNMLCSIYSDGVFTYQNFADDPYIFMSLLKASIELSFGDFFDSAARIFPIVAAIWGGLKTAASAVSNGLASENP